MLNEKSEPSLNKKQPPFVARLHFWVKEQEKKKKKESWSMYSWRYLIGAQCRDFGEKVFRRVLFS